MIIQSIYFSIEINLEWTIFLKNLEWTWLLLSKKTVSGKHSAINSKVRACLEIFKFNKNLTSKYRDFFPWQILKYFQLLSGVNWGQENSLNNNVIRMIWVWIIIIFMFISEYSISERNRIYFQLSPTMRRGDKIIYQFDKDLFKNPDKTRAHVGGNRNIFILPWRVLDYNFNKLFSEKEKIFC